MTAADHSFLKVKVYGGFVHKSVLGLARWLQGEGPVEMEGWVWGEN